MITFHGIVPDVFGSLREQLEEAGASVERILDQLLDHRRRPLDDLAGGDAVYSMLVQQPDTPHRKRAVASG